MFERRTVDVPQARLSYIEAGTSEPTLVLIHGLTDSLDAYLPLVEGLRQDFHVLAVDLRGHGDSSPVEGQYRVLDYAMDMEGFLSAVVKRPAVLVGCSLGALIACCVAARGEADILGVLLEDPPFYVGQMPTLREAAFYEFYGFLTELLPAHHLAAGTVDDLLPKVRNPLVGEDLQRTIAQNLHRLDLATVGPAMDGTLFDGFDPDTALQRIDCPMHIIVARDDPFGDAFRDDDLKKVKNLVSNLTYVLWRDTIHGIHYQRPDETVQEIRSFVRHLQGVAASLSHR